MATKEAFDVGEHVKGFFACGDVFLLSRTYHAAAANPLAPMVDPFKASA